MTNLFTKNLYIKEEVACALLCAILRNEKECATFWGLELYHSGYHDEVIDYLWTIYYSFHASLNPSFEKYFIRKLLDVSLTRSLLITTIIINLCNKPYTTDVYVLLNSTTLIKPKTKSFDEEWFLKKDYESIANYILSDDFDTSEEEMDAIRTHALNFYGIKWYREMLLPSPNICLKMRFLSHIMQICTTRVYNIPKKNRLNVSSERVEAPLENPHTSVKIRTRDILKNACKFEINCSNILHLFRLKRHGCETNPVDIKKCYREKWLYHCSQTPYWSEKIKDYGGTINVERAEIEFRDAEKEEAFFKEHSLEPDEQPIEVQNKSIQNIAEFEGDNAIVEFKKMFGKWDIIV
jgi:hypothetical protein